MWLIEIWLKVHELCDAGIYVKCEMYNLKKNPLSFYLNPNNFDNYQLVFFCSSVKLFKKLYHYELILVRYHLIVNIPYWKQKYSFIVK